MASSSPPPEEQISSPRDRCIICLHTSTNPARGKECTHPNICCLECLRRWSSTRQSPKCPLCQAEITVLCHAGGEEHVVESPPSADNEEADLGCLDHSYFAAEASRLLRRARSAQHDIAARAYGCGRRSSAQQDLASEALHQVIVSLTEKKEDLEQEEIPFDPGQMLQELYSLEEVLCSIQDGSFGGVDASTAAAFGGASNSPRRFSAADFHELSTDEEESHFYEESDDEDDEIARHTERLARMNLAATPGRKSLANHGRQKSRGGSRGSLTPAASSSSLGGTSMKSSSSHARK